MAQSRKLSVTMPSDGVVVITREFAAPRELLWAAFTRPDIVTRWMLGPDGWTMPVCEMDLRPGGNWHYVWRKSDGGEQMEMNGRFLEVTPPKRLTNTENWGGDWAESTTMLDLAERDGGRTLITQTLLYPSREARDRALSTGMLDGMEQSFDRLDDVLRSRPSTEPAQPSM